MAKFKVGDVILWHGHATAGVWHDTQYIVYAIDGECLLFIDSLGEENGGSMKYCKPYFNKELLMREFNNVAI